MPTPSGQISASQINYEIRAASNTTSLSLNATNPRRLARVSTTSGTAINFDNLRNKSITNVSSSISVSDFGFTIFPTVIFVKCTARYQNNGRLRFLFSRNPGSDFDETDNWLLSQWQDNTTYSGQYEIRGTQTGGGGSATRIGTMNSWMGLGTNREWSIERSSSTSTGFLTWNFTIDIREASAFNSSTPIVATHSISIGCEIST